MREEAEKRSANLARTRPAVVATAASIDGVGARGGPAPTAPPPAGEMILGCPREIAADRGDSGEEESGAPVEGIRRPL